MIKNQRCMALSDVTETSDSEMNFTGHQFLLSKEDQ
jgi:hypothetical protein